MSRFDFSLWEKEKESAGYERGLLYLMAFLI